MSLLDDLQLAMVHIQGHGSTMRVRANKAAREAMGQEAWERVGLYNAGIVGHHGERRISHFCGVEIEDLPDLDRIDEPRIEVTCRERPDHLFRVIG